MKGSSINIQGKPMAAQKVPTTNSTATPQKNVMSKRKYVSNQDVLFNVRGAGTASHNMPMQNNLIGLKGAGQGTQAQ